MTTSPNISRGSDQPNSPLLIKFGALARGTTPTLCVESCTSGRMGHARHLSAVSCGAMDRWTWGEGTALCLRAPQAPGGPTLPPIVLLGVLSRPGDPGLEGRQGPPQPGHRIQGQGPLVCPHRGTLVQLALHHAIARGAASTVGM